MAGQQYHLHVADNETRAQRGRRSCSLKWGKQLSVSREVASCRSRIRCRARLQTPYLLRKVLAGSWGLPQALSPRPGPRAGTADPGLTWGLGQPRTRPAAARSPVGGGRAGSRAERSTRASVLPRCAPRRPRLRLPPPSRAQPRGSRSRRLRFSRARGPPAASRHTYRASAPPPPCGPHDRRSRPRQAFRAALPDPPS